MLWKPGHRHRICHTGDISRAAARILNEREEAGKKSEPSGNFTGTSPNGEAAEKTAEKGEGRPEERPRLVVEPSPHSAYLCGIP
jgi:hypothetical protein